MADPIISDARGRLDVQALHQAATNREGYVYKDKQGRLRVSQRPLGGKFFGWGTSSKHREGFEQLRADVARRYGVQLQAGANGLLTIRNLNDRIGNARQQNIQGYQTWFNELHDRHSGVDAGVRNFAAQRLATHANNGTLASQQEINAVQTQINNRTARVTLGYQIQQLFGQAVRQEYEQQTQNALNSGSALSEREKQDWMAYAAGRSAAANLATRIQTEYGAVSQHHGTAALQAATNLLNHKFQAVRPDPRTMPSSLLDTPPQLPKEWINDALDAAKTAADQRTQQLRSQQLAQAPNANDQQQAINQANTAAQRATADVLLQHTNLLATSSAAQQVEQTLIASASEQLPTAASETLFGDTPAFPDKDIYQTARAIAGIDANAFVNRLRAKGLTDNNLQVITGNLAEAQQVARLGLALQRDGVPEKDAAILLRMETMERRAGRGNGNAMQWSPTLGNNLAASKQLAGRIAQQRQQAQFQPPMQSRVMFEHVLEAELSERADNRGNGDPSQLSAGVTRLLANNQQNLKAYVENGVSAMQALQLEAAAAAVPNLNLSREEIISCARLGVQPSAEMRPPNALVNDGVLDTRAAAVLNQWRNAGFNAVESLVYANPANKFTPQDIQEFAGSNLTPREIKLYRQLGVPYNDDTKPKHFIRSNRAAAPERFGGGSINQVYQTAHKTPAGVQRRIFKPLEHRKPSGWFLDKKTFPTPAETVKANIATSKLAKFMEFGGAVVNVQLGFERIQDRLGREQLRLGISMEQASGKSASEWRFPGWFIAA